MASGSRPNPMAPLDELRIVVIVDNETDTLSSIDRDVPQIPEILQLLQRTPADRHHDGHECKTVFDRLCCACHGLSVMMTGCRDGEPPRSLLFDVGPYPDLWLENADRLAIDLSTIECVFLSHWHFDHSGGLAKVVGAIRAARDKAGRPPPVVDLHPDRPDQRGILLPNGVMAMLPAEPTFEEIAAAGAHIEKHDAAHALCDGFFSASGAIDRVTDYETGLAGHHSFFGERCERDELIMDERSITAHVRGRGVTVLSACSHAGIVNACLDARRRFDDAPVDLVLGGYHLAGAAMEPRIDATVQDLKARIQPRLLAPGHCTGWRAKAKLAEAFAPGQYAPSVVGTAYRLQAPG